MRRVDRRDFLRASSSALAALVFPHRSREPLEATDPWPTGVPIEPAALAELIQHAEHPPTVLCVGFPELYKRKHISHAGFAGPASTPEGIAALRVTLTRLPKTTPLVLYCGCCPLRICPNVPPAFRLARKLGFRHVRVLNLVKDFDIDWAKKGYPATPA